MKKGFYKNLSFLLTILIGSTLFMSSKSVKCTAKAPVCGKAECVMELESRRILYERNAETKLPMASTTKIATAITVLENCDDLESEFEIPQQAIGTEGSSIYLKTGDKYSTKDLLYGLMLRSGNDSAVALAIHTSGSVVDFAKKMNETAQKSGALSTNFANPHGLPCKEHYTTARDLSLITCYALHNSIFREIVSTRKYEPRSYINKNKMLYTFDGAIGVKTGYTVQAGRCLVSAVKRGEMTLVCTVLSCPAMYERSCSLFDDAFSSYEYKCVQSSKSPVLLDIDGQKVNAFTKKDLFYPILPEEQNYIKKEIHACPEDKFDADGKKIIGELKIYLLNKLIFSENLYKL